MPKCSVPTVWARIRCGVYELDPIRDPRWPAFVETHRFASVFHGPAWLEALSRTYGYTPRAFTTAAPGQALTDGIVFGHVESWLTGSRMISVPFADHCDPLVSGAGNLASLMRDIRGGVDQSVRYTELRPRHVQITEEAGLYPQESFCLHTVDLKSGSDTLYEKLHKSSIRRKISRSNREGLVVEAGCSELLIDAFYRLLLVTRRRQGIPPQPRVWFGNLAKSFGPGFTVWLARKGTRPIASIVTLRFRNTVVYKYGCSDAEFHSLGGMPRLFWEAIEAAVAEKKTEFDLGRTDRDNPGLITFKDRLGAKRSALTYWRAPARRSKALGLRPVLNLAIPYMPDIIFKKVGEMLYRHVA